MPRTSPAVPHPAHPAAPRESGTAADLRALEAMTADSPRARRNLRFGLWVAGRLGRAPGAEACAYAWEVMQSDHEEPGDADVLGKAARDLGGDRAATEAALRDALRRFERQARDETLHHD